MTLIRGLVDCQVPLLLRGSLLEEGRPSGIKSWARRVSVPIAFLRSSLRSGSMFIVFKITNVGYRRGDLVCHERAISFISRLTPIYPLHGRHLVQPRRSLD